MEPEPKDGHERGRRVLDGSRLYSSMHELREIDWRPGYEDEVTRVLQLAGAMPDAVFVIPDGLQ